MNKTVLATVCAMLTACAPSFPLLSVNKPLPAQTPAVEIPEGVTPMGLQAAQNESWWLSLNSPELTAVIEQALVNNTDVRLANEQLNEAGAQLGIAKSARWPAIYGQITETRNRPSQVGSVPVLGTRSVNEATRLGIGSSWELDLWGRVGALKDAAAATFMQQGYNLRGVRLSVSAAAAALYTRIQELNFMVRVAEQTMNSRQEALGLAQKRADVGLIDDLDLRRVEAEYLAVKAQLPDLRESHANAVNALAVLVGGNAPAISELAADHLTVTNTWIVPEGAPSDLLLRRPDLAAAEQQLVAAKASLTAARKAFFPSISLTAFAGRESAALDNLFTGPAKIWNFSANLTQPIFQAGRLFDEQDAAVARSNQAVIVYEAAIRSAFGEVYDAIVAQREARERLAARAEQVVSLQKVVELAKMRVDAGVAGQLELLDAQRNLLAAQLDWVQAWGSQQRAVYGMVTALGGGFNVQ